MTGPRGERRPLAGRDLALLALHRVDTAAAFASLALHEVFRRHPAPRRERALATELAYGAVRRLNTLDFIIGRFSHRDPAALDPWTRSILRLAVYQICYSDRIPVHAAVAEAVEQAKRYGHRDRAGFVNAVLRAVASMRGEVAFPSPDEDPVAHLSLAHSHPEWLVRRWLGRYGFEDARRLLEYDNVAPPVVIRANRLRTDPQALALRLAEEGVEVRPGRYLPEALVIVAPEALEEIPSFRAGLFTVQDESSMLAARVLDPQPGETVIDVAAAPGGKTTHIAELMANRGRIIACDVHPGRLELVRENCRRLGVTIVEAVAEDGRELPARYRALADRVLLDAPCSGLGVLNRRPDARWRKSAEQIAALAALQGELLEAAAACLAPGGVLVYSTCTIEPEENEQVVARFLDAHPDFAPDPLDLFLPAGLAGEGAGGWLQILPFRHGIDGFFVARLRRAR